MSAHAGVPGWRPPHRNAKRRPSTVTKIRGDFAWNRGAPLSNSAGGFRCHCAPPPRSSYSREGCGPVGWGTFGARWTPPFALDPAAVESPSYRRFALPRHAVYADYAAPPPACSPRPRRWSRRFAAWATSTSPASSNPAAVAPTLARWWRRARGNGLPAGVLAFAFVYDAPGSVLRVGALPRGGAGESAPRAAGLLAGTSRPTTMRAVGARHRDSSAPLSTPTGRIAVPLTAWFPLTDTRPRSTGVSTRCLRTVTRASRGGRGRRPTARSCEPQIIRALPRAAGSLLAGARTSSTGRVPSALAEGPRVSLSCEFQRADRPSTPWLDPAMRLTSCRPGRGQAAPPVPPHPLDAATATPPSPPARATRRAGRPATGR